jgi:hypothetical protein
MSEAPSLPFLQYFSIMFQMVGGVLRLSPEPFLLLVQSPNLHGMVVWIVFIGGLSKMTGNSVVLFANRVKPIRFFISMFLAATQFTLNVFITTSFVWAIFIFLFNINPEYLDVVRTISLAYAPYWLGFLVFIPYLGTGIERLLRLYVMVTLIIGLRTVFGLSFLSALVNSLFIYLVVVGVDYLLGKIFTPLGDRLNTWAMGVGKVVQPKDIYAEFAAKEPPADEQ